MRHLLSTSGAEKIVFGKSPTKIPQNKFMPYYDTIDEDLARAKQILAEGKAELGHHLDCDEYHQHVAPQCCALDCWCRSPHAQHAETVLKLVGGTIYGKDTFAAYKLLESFVEEIERLRATEPERTKMITRLRVEAGLQRFRAVGAQMLCVTSPETQTDPLCKLLTDAADLLESQNPPHGSS